MHTKLAGVTFPKNAQTTLPKLNTGDEITLIREPENQYDKNAIRTEALGERIGFLPAHVARELAHRMDNGENFKCIVAQITGGGDKTYGCNVELEEVGEIGKTAPSLPNQDELDEI